MIRWSIRITRIVFLLSLILIIYAGLQIISADQSVDQTLQEWEKIKKEASEFVEVSRFGEVSDFKDASRFEELPDESPTSLIDPSLFNQLPSADSQSPDFIEKQRHKQAEKEPKGEAPPIIKEEKITYRGNPKSGEVFGKISFPTLKKEYPILHGTDAKSLSKGVGHYIGSAFPGASDNSVLAGHRDTVFRKLGSVKVGDEIKIETLEGIYTYEVVEQQIVDEDDRTIIVPMSEPTLTLITCYPFDFVGSAPQRYILTAKLKTP